MNSGMLSRGRFVLGACVAAALALSFGATAEAQQGKYVAQASSRLIKLIDAANGNGYKLDDNTFSIGGGWLKQSTSNYVGLFNIKLVAGKQYRFLAAGDNDARDVDLEVIDANGNSLAKDAKINPEAIVNFTPKTSGSFQVRVRLYASDNSVPCVCLAIVMSK